MMDTLRVRHRFPMLAVMLGLIGCASAFAQDADQPPPADQDQPPAGTAQAQPADANEAEQQVPKAVVIEVAGPVEWSLPGVSPVVDEGWTPVQLNDAYEPGTQIRTGLRAHVNLKFGETTFVSIRSATHASIDQFYRSATTETVRVGLAYGTVRGGSTEGPIKADVEVDSTVATLSKRGTEGWQMWVEPTSNRFRVSLAEHGLVEAIQKLAPGKTRSKSVRPGEYVTTANIANLWIAQARFDHNVQFYPAETVTVANAISSTETPTAPVWSRPAQDSVCMTTPVAQRWGAPARACLAHRRLCFSVSRYVDRMATSGRAQPFGCSARCDDRVFQC